jgi:pimeloyl-ACP methyl ester carboxylesterase
LIVHGILGAGRNWRGIAKTAADRYPKWRFALPDLRNHGDAPPATPPHTIAACAQDLAELTAEIGAPELVIGHSFGGKVALVYARDHGAGLRAAWSLDSPPGPASAAGTDTVGILEAVSAAPVPSADRREIRAFLASRGVSEPVIAWLATSLAERDDGWRWKYDLPGVRAMIADYLALDLWPFASSGQAELRLVRAGRGDRWSAEDLAQLDKLPPSTQSFVLPDAGHWLHVDDPEGLLALLARDLA